MNMLDLIRVVKVIISMFCYINVIMLIVLVPMCNNESNNVCLHLFPCVEMMNLMMCFVVNLLLYCYD